LSEQNTNRLVYLHVTMYSSKIATKAQNHRFAMVISGTGYPT